MLFYVTNIFCRIASKYNMRLVYKTGFHELFNEKHKDYGNLLHKMQALEVEKMFFLLSKEINLLFVSLFSFK